MRVLVAGAGVAGSVAAMALHKAGFEPVVFDAYERSAGLAHGVYLTVAVNGLDALRAVDSHHVVRYGAQVFTHRLDAEVIRPLLAGRLGGIPAGQSLP